MKKPSSVRGGATGESNFALLARPKLLSEGGNRGEKDDFPPKADLPLA